VSHRAIAEITTAGVLHRVDLLDAVVNLLGLCGEHGCLLLCLTFVVITRDPMSGVLSVHEIFVHWSA
jgi:hypothetical protein